MLEAEKTMTQSDSNQAGSNQVAFRVDASIDIGSGHVMRCLTLAKALKEMGFQVRFICRHQKGHLIDKITSDGFEVEALTTRPGDDRHRPSEKGPTETTSLAHADWLEGTQLQDAQACQPILAQIQPDWLIVDHYALDQTWEKALRPYCRKLMVIDDLGDRTHACDLLLDQNYGASEQTYQGRVPLHCQRLLGTQYVLLRPEFAQWRLASLKRRKNNTEVHRILVTMGGVDSDNHTGDVLTQLAKVDFDPQVTLTVIMGAKAPHLETVKQQAAKMRVPTQVKIDVPNMAEIMAQADLAIGAAGATTWERCCLGLPSIQWAIADNQQTIAKRLAKARIALLITQAHQLPGLVDSAPDWMSEFSDKAQSVCDGMGVQRVCEHVAV